MLHESGLIATISVGLVAAFIGGAIATRLRLPAIVGYLLAGIAVGPFTPGFVGDAEVAPQLAEIGVILLMFGVGLHFSVRDLLAVRAIALPGAVVQITLATVLGIGLTQWWGWSFGEGLVLGLALAVASTVVLLRALIDHDLLDTIHGRIAVGWLIVEDLFTVLVLVLLPALAVPLGGIALAGATGDSALVTLALALGKVAIFAVVMFVIGVRVVPWLLAQVARWGSRELFTLAILGVALGIAFGAAQLFGVSFALGAFVAGLVVGESDLSHRAAAEALPLRDAFAVLFFVSVGMLFDPAILLNAPWQVLGVVAIIIVGKALGALGIVLVLGYPLRTGLVVAAGLAQVGEFSFILTDLGRRVGLLPEAGQQLLLAGALLSITLNPLLFLGIEPLLRWLEQHPRLAARLERRTQALVDLPSGTDEHSVRGQTVICGYGRVGSVIGLALERHGEPFVIVEQDYRRVEELRARGLAAIYGDAASPAFLEHLDLAPARALIVATAEPLVTRQIVEHARHLHPDLPIIARTHEWGELAALRGHGASAVVMGELELALALAGHALRLGGATTAMVQDTLGDLREHAVLPRPRQTFA